MLSFNGVHSFLQPTKGAVGTLTFLSFAKAFDNPLIDFVFGLSINVHQQLPSTIEPESDEGRGSEFSNRDDLNFGIIVLDLRKMPKNELFSPGMIFLPSIVVKSEDSDVGFENEVRLRQVLE